MDIKNYWQSNCGSFTSFNKISKEKGNNHHITGFDDGESCLFG